MTSPPPRVGNFCALTAGLVLGLPVTAVHPACGWSSPAQLTWGAGGSGGSGTWDTSTPDRFDGANNVPWTNGDDAPFAGTVTADKVTFSTAGYTVQNFFLEGAASGPTVETDANATFAGTIQANGSATLAQTAGSSTVKVVP